MLDRASPPVDLSLFRRALGSFGTGIAIATCRAADGAPCGMTVNSLTSVSLEPQLLLFCLGRTTRVYADFRQAATFSLNILTQDQEVLARHFASRSAADWSTIPLLPGLPDTPPLLQNCLATITCRRYAAHEAGDHDILIGAVAAIGPVRDAEPLLYYRGQYRRF